MPVLDNPFESIYIQAGRVGLASYHFNIDLTKCYISYLDAPFNWRLVNGNYPPNKKYFEETSYDSNQRIFKGIIRWGDNPFRNGANTWKYSMQFSTDFTSIESGTIDSFDIDDNFQYSQPFQINRELSADPRQQGLVYKMYAENEASKALDVFFERFNLCHFCRGELEDTVKLGCTHLACYSCFLQGVKTDCICTHCGTEIFLAACVRLNTGKALSPRIDNPFGQSYIQDNHEGLASYHFDHLNPYISYKNAPDDWVLDNGEKPPVRVKFQNWKYR